MELARHALPAKDFRRHARIPVRIGKAGRIRERARVANDAMTI
jgi:hypothetical protein